jgi:NB-ARC domain/Restriction endonuclease
MNLPRPPIRPRVALLPFNDPQQSWLWFEEAVRDLLRRLPQFRNVEAYGVQGDHQEGIDVCADADDGHIGIQCKKKTQFGPTDVTSAVAAATYPAHRFILALSRRATAKARCELKKHSKWEFWDQTRLSDAVRSLPPAESADYVGRHFHHTFIEEFLGQGRPSTLTDRASAVYVTAPAMPFNYVERAQALATLQQAVLDDRAGPSIAMIGLHGMGGIGKTVLAKALAHDDDFVEHHFPDGVVWISIGKEPRDDVVTRLREVGKTFRDDLSAYDTERGSKNQYKTIIRNKAALIILGLLRF